MFVIASHDSHQMKLLRQCVSVVYCPKLPKPFRGTLSTDKTAYNTQVIVVCDIGFKHAGGQTSKTVLCLDDATWNDTDVDCQDLY